MTPGLPTKIAAAMVFTAVQVAYVDVAGATTLHRSHPHKHHIATEALASTATEAPAPARMRYFGGPKSPMWPEAR